MVVAAGAVVLVVDDVEDVEEVDDVDVLDVELVELLEVVELSVARPFSSSSLSRTIARTTSRIATTRPPMIHGRRSGAGGYCGGRPPYPPGGVAPVPGPGTAGCPTRVGSYPWSLMRPTVVVEPGAFRLGRAPASGPRRRGG